MKRRPLLEYIEIPKDYLTFIEFIEKNSKLILSDFDLTSRILDELNSRLDGAIQPSDLHHDSSMILATIRFYQEAMSKEYQHNLDIKNIVDSTNKGHFDDYFEICKSRFMRAKFVDQLDFAYTPKEPVQRVARKYNDVSTQPANIPNVVRSIKEDYQESQAIADIKDMVSAAGEIEYFTLILDKESYSKTIYNAFNLALAIRTKLVSLVEDNGIIYVTRFQSGDGEVDHSVLEITSDLYKKLLAKYSTNNPTL